MLPLFLAMACGGVKTIQADFQLDILGAELHDTDRIRVCIQGETIKEQALGAGLIAVTGLSGDISVSVHQIDGDESMGHTEVLSLNTVRPFIVSDWRLSADETVPCTLGANNTATDTGHILAVRFHD